jgi:hypothetical protein
MDSISTREPDIFTRSGGFRGRFVANLSRRKVRFAAAGMRGECWIPGPAGLCIRATMRTPQSHFLSGPTQARIWNAHIELKASVHAPWPGLQAPTRLMGSADRPEVRETNRAAQRDVQDELRGSQRLGLEVMRGLACFQGICTHRCGAFFRRHDPDGNTPY